MVLIHSELQRLLDKGVIVGATPELINGSSIDITLGYEIMVEVPRSKWERSRVDIHERSGLGLRRQQLLDGGYQMQPGEFLLGCSAQVFNLPLDLSADYKQKSSVARMGLQHLNAGWCDPGWTGSALTLELMNVTRNHHIVIRPGDRIGQLVFHRHTPVAEGYSYAATGRYNGDTAVMGAKQ